MCQGSRERGGFEAGSNTVPHKVQEQVVLVNEVSSNKGAGGELFPPNKLFWERKLLERSREFKILHG